jgi:DNA invertase Pin-like site-specific DNA recombinase
MTVVTKRRPIAERLAEKHVSAAPSKIGRPPMAFFYVRFSTLEQKNGYSEELQVAAIERLFAAEYAPLGYVTAPAIYLDAGKSAYKIPFPKRESAARLLADVQAGDVVIVYKIDRCFRRVMDCAETVDYLRKMGVRVRACDFDLDYETAMGKAMLGMMSVFAELESSMKSERTKAGLAIAIQGGACCGPPPAFIEKVVHRTRKRWVIKKQYVDALDWMATEMRKEKPMSVHRLLLETRKRMAAADKEFVPQKHYGLSRTQFYDSVKPRFLNWSKAEGRTIDHIMPFTSEVTKRWLYPQPEKEEA